MANANETDRGGQVRLEYWCAMPRSDVRDGAVPLRFGRRLLGTCAAMAQSHRAARRGGIGCRARLGLVALLAALAGCAAGPDFQRPAEPETARYTATPIRASTVAAAAPHGHAQRLVEGLPMEVQWWRSLGAVALDELIEAALAANPTLASARATLRQAEEIHAARAGSTRYPQVDAVLGAQRQRFNPGSLGQSGDAREFGVYNVGIEAHYDLDLAGANRRALEALAARADYRRFEVAAARLTVAGNIAVAAISRARLDAQSEATSAILQAQEAQLGLARERVRLGQASPDEALALQTQVEQTRAELPVLREQLQQTEHLLAVLAGRSPGEEGMPAFTLADFTLPVELPLLVPSALVRFRPDIQAAEALLHAANADYGVAVAKLYPQLTLSAGAGTQALTTAALFGSGSAVWSVVGQLTQPLFDPGLPAEKRAALAAFDAAAANYQSTVLEALRDVADALRAVENDAERLAALARADQAAQGSLRAVALQYRFGAASYVQLLIAQEQAQRTRLGLAAAQAERLTDSVALYQAMGGVGVKDSGAGRGLAVRRQAPTAVPCCNHAPCTDRCSVALSLSFPSAIGRRD